MAGAAQAPIATLADMQAVLGQAGRARSTASTAMNTHSSRSHSVLMLRISGEHAPSGTRLCGSLNLVDLAGRRALHALHASRAASSTTQALNLAVRWPVGRAQRICPPKGQQQTLAAPESAQCKACTALRVRLRCMPGVCRLRYE